MPTHFTPNGTTVGGGVPIDIDNGAEIVKIRLGADGVDNGTVSAGNPLPVVGVVSGAVTVTSGTVTLSQPVITTTRYPVTGALTDQAVVTPNGGKILNVTRISVTPDNDNTAKFTFRLGCGTTNTPTTTGVIVSHPGLGNIPELTIGNGRDLIGLGTVNQPLRLTCSDPLGAVDIVCETYES